MAPGDVLVVFTDGLVEAESMQGVEFGDESIVSVVQGAPEQDADGLLEQILVACFKHMEGSGFRDDVTLMVVRRV